MDVTISGGGNVGAGEYDTIRISGSGQLEGPLVRCKNLYVSGSTGGEEIVCENELHVSGSGAFSGKIAAGSVAISGGFSCDDDMNATERIAISGGVQCGGSMKCRLLKISGNVTISGDAEAETAKIRGQVNCEGLLNAEEIDIEYQKGMTLGSVGGSKIAIYRKNGVKKKLGRLPLFESLVGKADAQNVHVGNQIEGDEIKLEGVIAPRVSGRIVTIGAECEIELVQYSEQVEISSDAKVGRTEKI